MTCNRLQLAQIHAHNCDDGCMTSAIKNIQQKHATALGRYALAAMVLVSSASAWAQAGTDCVPGGSTAQTNACTIQEFQQLDTNNSILYSDVMRALSGHERPSLRKEQSEWARSRNLQCKKSQQAFEAQADWPRRFHECLIGQIKARNAVLKQWLNHGAPQ